MRPPHLLILDEPLSTVLVGHHLACEGTLPAELELKIPKSLRGGVIGQRHLILPFPPARRLSGLFVELLDGLKAAGIPGHDLRRMMGPLRRLSWPFLSIERRVTREARSHLSLWTIPPLWFPWGGESGWAYYLPPLQMGARLGLLSTKAVHDLSFLVEFTRTGVWAFLPLEGLLLLVGPFHRAARANPKTL